MMLLGAPGNRLPDVILPAEKAKLTKEPFGDLRIYFEGSTGSVKSMTAGSLRLNPGMSPHPPHAHEEEEFILITEGAGEISIDGKVTKAGPGDMMYCGSNKLHGIASTGNTHLLFYFWKWK